MAKTTRYIDHSIEWTVPDYKVMYFKGRNKTGMGHKQGHKTFFSACPCCIRLPFNKAKKLYARHARRAFRLNVEDYETA